MYIPKKIIRAAHIELNQPLTVSLQGTSIVLTPLNEPEKDNLYELLKGVTPAIVNGEMEWGQAISAERYK